MQQARPPERFRYAAYGDIDLDAVADALVDRDITHDPRGNRIRSDCPNCGRTGRKGRRPLVITELPRGLVSHTDCGCEIVDVARALDLPANALLLYRKTILPGSRDAYSRTSDRQIGLPADAKPRGVTRIETQARRSMRGNLRAVLAVARDLDRLGLRDWRAYDSRRAAKELRMERTSVRRALRWLVLHGIIEERQLPAPGEKIVTERGELSAKSGVKQYRALTEQQQIARLSRRAER